MEDALKKKWPFFRLVPSAKMEAAKVTEIILSRWKNEPLALIEDGTIHGRELVESVRAALAEVGLTPVFSDTYRPAQEQQVSLVRRLAKSGATHVFTGGDRADTAIIARDAAIRTGCADADGRRGLERGRPARSAADGVLAVSLPDYAARPEAKAAGEAMTAAKLCPGRLCTAGIFCCCPSGAGKGPGRQRRHAASGRASQRALSRPQSARSASTRAMNWRTIPIGCSSGETADSCPLPPATGTE